MNLDAPPCIAKNHSFIKGGKVCIICWWAPKSPEPWPKGQPKPRHRKKSEFQKVAEYWGDRCVFCDGPASTRDHLIPRSRGGSNKLDNLRPACRSCNNKKADKTPLEWLGDRCPEQFRGLVAPLGQPQEAKPLKVVGPFPPVRNSERVKPGLTQSLAEVWPDWMTPDNADF